MATSTSLLNTYNVKSMVEIRDDYLRTYSNALINFGITDPDVSIGTAIYIHATALATEMAALSYNQQLLANGVLPDSAQGNDLIRQGNLVFLTLQPATSSVGFITLSSTLGTTPITIITGTQLIDNNGLKYAVSTGGLYQDGYDIPIESVDKGGLTNLVSGSVLRWVTTPPFAKTTAVINGDLKGGADTETLEDLRSRVLDTWRDPAAAGNATQIALWAEASSPAIQKAFIYCIAGGPGSVFVRLVSAQTDSDKSRQLNTRSNLDSATLMANVVAPYIKSFLPEYVELNVNDVNPQTMNVSIGLSLTASNGWVNANINNIFPFYTPSSGPADVTAVTSSTIFTLNSDLAPVDDVTQICWLSPLDFIFYSALVVSHSGSGPWTITLNKPFTGIAIGHIISPLAVNSQQYFTSLISQFGNLGPSQLTDQAALLPRANRVPNPALAYPSSVGPSVLKFLVSTGSEILDVQYLFRSDLGAGEGQPTLPTDVTQKANILVPGNLSFYPLV